MFSSTTAAWLSYGFVAHQTSLVVVNLITGPTTWSILARISLSHRNRLKGVVAFMVALLSALIIAVVPAPAVYALAAIEVIAILPQLIEVFRPGDLSGVSITTWLATILAQSLWGVYGVFAHQTALSLGGFAGAALGAVVALKITTTRRSTPSTSSDATHL